MDNPLQIVVVTGLSGAGRSTALRVLEDAGFYCVDNLPPALAGGLVDLVGQPSPDPGQTIAPPDRQPLKRIGLGIDVRTGAFLNGVDAALKALEASGHRVEVIFLDCADAVLVRRFSETRRPHALAPGGDLEEAIGTERERLATLRARADIVIDTTDFSVHDLRRQLIHYVSQGGDGRQMVVRLVSFGFKYGLPVDADLVFDLRYLPNPHFEPELRPLTGLDARVSDYVLQSDEGQAFLQKLLPLLEHTIPKYAQEGKAYLTVAVGCTGGRHRSVAMVEELSQRLSESASISVSHRDAGRATT